jgi:SnoaL-like domain
MPMTVADWLAGYRKAWMDRDADAAAALFTENASYRVQPYEEAHVGPAGVHAYWAGVTATQDAVELRYGTPVVEGNRAAVEWWVTLLSDGAEITLAGEFMLRFDENGLCEELREYWQFAEGKLEPPAGWGA